MVLAMVVNIFIVLVFFITLVNGQTMEEEGREESIKKLQEQMGVLKNDLEKHDAFVSRLEQLVIKQEHGMRANDFLRRSCYELRSFNPLLPSGMYWLDPDGMGVGEAPIYVYCDLTTGSTFISHDTQSTMTVTPCQQPGCYSRSVAYNAPMKQIFSLIDLSLECHQSIQYDCVSAPLQVNGVAQSWWLDRNSVARFFWTGSADPTKRNYCQCGINSSCIDSGFISNKELLPITSLRFGRTLNGRHTLGQLVCNGQVNVSHEMPSSCYDLWLSGQTQSGIYSIKESGRIQVVYCDMTKSKSNKVIQQQWIGYLTVQSQPVYFHVQRFHHYSIKNSVIPFEVERLNIGAAMNVQTGVFTTPRSGVYFFSFNGISRGDDSKSSLQIQLQLNGKPVATAYGGSDSSTVSLQTAIKLNRQDKVSLWLSWGSLLYLANHFTGFLLQEHL